VRLQRTNTVSPAVAEPQGVPSGTFPAPAIALDLVWWRWGGTSREESRTTDVAGN